MSYKAILINTEAEQIYEVEIKKDSLEDIYKNIKCAIFTCVYLDNGDVIFVDDEGLFAEKLKLFKYENYKLAGNGLIVGTDSKGNSINPKTTLSEAIELTTFL